MSRFHFLGGMNLFSFFNVFMYFCKFSSLDILFSCLISKGCPCVAMMFVIPIVGVMMFFTLLVRDVRFAPFTFNGYAVLL